MNRYFRKEVKMIIYPGKKKVYFINNQGYAHLKSNATSFLIFHVGRDGSQGWCLLLARAGEHAASITAGRSRIRDHQCLIPSWYECTLASLQIILSFSHVHSVLGIYLYLLLDISKILSKENLLSAHTRILDVYSSEQRQGGTLMGRVGGGGQRQQEWGKIRGMWQKSQPFTSEKWRI